MEEREQDLRLMLRCAQLFYRGHLSQIAIARKLGQSESKVSRLLRAAKDRIVQVQIKASYLHQLELELMERFQLQDAIVVMVGDESYTNELLGEAAARYFERTVRDGAKITICGGSTLYEFVDALVPEPKKLEIYALSTWIPEAMYVSEYTLAGILCAKFRPETIAHGFQIPLPIVPAEENAALLDMPVIREIYEAMLNVDFAYIGIGNLSSNSKVAIFAKYSQIDLDSVKKVATGSINYQVFDEEGNIIPYDWYKKTIAIPAKRLREMAAHPTKRVVAVAGGREKIESIRAALKGKFFDTLITDEVVARNLLEKSPEM
ncbi:MAG: hypothetical protein H8D67_01495 [Deltaproteobacteria bacterium]|nr:hypothetical protein [Deltaproteobacteria bacterium]